MLDIQLSPLWKRKELGEEEEDSSTEHCVLGSTQPAQEIIADPQQVVLGEGGEEDGLPPCGHLHRTMKRKVVEDNMIESRVTSCSTVLNNSSQLSRVSRSNMSERRVIGVPEEHKAFLAAWDIFQLRFYTLLIFLFISPHLNCKLCDKFPAGWNIWFLGGSGQQHICEEFSENLGIKHDQKHIPSREGRQ